MPISKDQTFFTRIAANVQEVRQRIVEAAKKAGRGGSDIALVAVSKYASVEDGMVEALVAAGCVDLGESRPRMLFEKAEYFTNLPVRWHMIGPLQRNKIRKILPHVALVHSIDSLRLAEAVDRIAEEENRRSVDVLLEVAVSEDATKHGFDSREIPAALDKIACLEHVAVKGIMCMSGLGADKSKIRRQFAALRDLTDSLCQKGIPENVSLSELSMGMSDDFEIAVEEGATLVRIGSLLYR